MNAPVVFETLSPETEPDIARRLAAGGEVYFLTPDAVPPEMARLREHAAGGRLAPLAVEDPLHKGNDPSTAPAFAEIDEVYARFVQGAEWAPPLLARLLGSSDAELAFKKFVLDDLGRVHHARMLMAQIARALPGRGARFVPMFALDAELLRRYPAGGGADGVAVDDDAAARGRRAWHRRNWRACALTLYVGLRAFGSWLRGLGASPDRRHFSYGVTIVSPIRQFANRFRAPDAFLDGKRITRDNTVFIAVEPIDAAQRAQLRERGLHFAVPGDRTPTGLMVRVLLRAPWLALRLMLAPGRTAPCTAAMFKEMWLWSALAREVNVGKFATLSDFHFRHVARNILLKTSGTETYYCLDTENLTCLSLAPEGSEPHRHLYWGFLYYDHCLTWSERMIAYYKRHKQAIGDYEAIGIIWADAIRLLREGPRLAELEHELTADLRAAGARKIVSVFDSSYVNYTRTTYEDGAQFALGIERLLADNDDIGILFKEKKARSVHPPDASFGLVDIYRRLEAHPRCRFVGFQAASEEVLAVSDLCIAFPFTSSASELMAAGGRAVFYAPNAKFHGSAYRRVPDVVAESPAELTALVRKWVFTVSDQDYRAFLDAHLKGMIDPYLDGRAFERLRRRLSAD